MSRAEPIEDVLTVFALVFPVRTLDRLYSRYRNEAIRSGEFVATLHRLFEREVLVNGPDGLAVKGPNWRLPKFLEEKNTVMIEVFLV